MGVFNKIFGTSKQNISNKVENVEFTTTDISMANFMGLGEYDTDLSEITYFTCLKMLSESLGKLNIDLLQDTEKGTIKRKDHPAYRVLKLKPNVNMTSSIFKALVEYNRNHYGNAYIYPRFEMGKLKSLEVLNNNYVTILVDNIGMFKNDTILYQYHDPGTYKTYLFKPEEIIHLKNSINDNGIEGKAVVDILRSTMQGQKANQKFLNNLYKNGLTARSVLQYTGDLDKQRQKELIKAIEEFATGAHNSGKIIPLPLGMNLTPLDLKLTDSQFLELKQYSSLQIAAAFGIKPNQLNDYSKSSYSSSEAQNLSFYVDTLLFILRQWEEEFTEKLLTEKEKEEGLYFKFNVSSILRADIKTQAEVLSMYRNNGILTGNECREMLDKELIEHADELLMNGTFIPARMAGQQYGATGEGENNA